VPVGWNWTTNQAGNVLQYTLSSGAGVPLAPASSVTNQFRITASQGVYPGLTWTNSALLAHADTILGTPPGGIRSGIRPASPRWRCGDEHCAGQGAWATSETNAVDSTNALVQIGETVTYG